MKAKYKHYGNECIIYNQVICEDNIVTEIQSYIIGWADGKPKTNVIVCDNEQKAINLYNTLCDKLQQKSMSANIGIKERENGKDYTRYVGESDY